MVHTAYIQLSSLGLQRFNQLLTMNLHSRLAKGSSQSLQLLSKDLEDGEVQSSLLVTGGCRLLHPYDL